MVRILLVSIALLFLTVPLCCQDNAQGRNYQTMEGTVTSLDWVGSVMAVNDTSFSVPSNANIYKGSDQIGFDDINVGDPVTVTYYDDPPGVHRIVTIVVQYSGDWAV